MSRCGGLLATSLVLSLGLTATAPAGATQVKIFQLQSQKAFLKGTLEGVSIDSEGRLQLADRAERVAAVGEPFLFSAAPHPKGWVVGTGNDGKVLLVHRDGTVEELLAASEGQVFAVWADPDGTVFAGVSPGGKVYRIPPGAKDLTPEKALWFDTGETYVWALARAKDGSLLVGTGTSGKLFRVTGKGEGSVLYDSDDTHVRSLAVLPGGDILVGTAGDGLILRVAADGSKARTLYDADQPEVVAFAAHGDGGDGADGSFYAAAIASEASPVDLAAAAAASARAAAKSGQAAAGATPGEPGAKGKPTVTVHVGPAAAGSRPAGFSGKRSEVLSISPEGVVTPVWSFDDETVFDLLWNRGRLWVATGLEGKLYSFDGRQMVLEKEVEERQVVALLPGEPGPAFATTNAPAVYRLTAARERKGTYTSPALDAGAVARFGTLSWRGAAGKGDKGGKVEFAARSGVSEEPDATWSDWTEPRAPSAEGEVSLAGVPEGRYVQWRVTLEGGGGAESSPRIDGVELSYRQENLRPKISAFQVLDPGEILVPAGFNPSQQVYEPAHPNKQGIFTTLEKANATEEGRVKTLWKKGYRSFRWSAADPNGDDLVYSLQFRPLDLTGETAGKTGKGAGSGAGVGAGGDWLTVADDLDDDYYSFDSTVLPDGVYRFRLTASDAKENAPGEGETGEELSEPVVIDHSPPNLVEATRKGGSGGGTLRVVLEDAWNPLRAAEVSVNAGDWKPAPAADGLLDARREVLEIPVPNGAKLLLLRVTDAALNVATYDLSARLQ